ncbi:MAG: CotH kinase family protein [Suipraeoptans sp.]
MLDKNNRGTRALAITVIIAMIAFVILYVRNTVAVEEIPNQDSDTLIDWTLETSDMNNIPLEEDKSIYSDEPDGSLYDVYISVFPTKSDEGDMYDFNDFDLHESRDHTYNPVLNCNIQIVDEDETLDPLTAIDNKNATIRVRGNSARGDTYKSYKVKMSDEAATFFGQTTLNINKHSEDITKMATVLETRLLTQMDDITSFQTNYLRVWIRDTSEGDDAGFKYYGIYTHIEQPNKSYLEKRGLSSNANMYKARDFSFQQSEVLKNVDDPEYSLEDFETVLTIREGNNHTKLLEMIDAVNDYEQDFQKVFDKYFNEENYLTWLAFNIIFGNTDIINHNFIIYNPDNSNTWYFMAWDFDGSLRFGDYESSLMKLPTSLRGIQKLNQSVIHRRFFRLNGSVDKLTAKIDELIDTVITRENVEELVSVFKPSLEKTVIYEPDLGLLDMTPDELNIYLDNLYDGIEENVQIHKESLQYPMPMYVMDPEERSDGSIYFTWDASYSYQGRTIQYNVKIYSDYNMEEMVYEENNISDTFLEYKEGLMDGIYYLYVTAVDSEGNEQLSMERYETMLTETKALNVNGLLEFEVGK